MRHFAYVSGQSTHISCIALTEKRNILATIHGNQTASSKASYLPASYKTTYAQGVRSSRAATSKAGPAATAPSTAAPAPREDDPIRSTVHGTAPAIAAQNRSDSKLTGKVPGGIFDVTALIPTAQVCVTISRCPYCGCGPFSSDASGLVGY